MIHGGVLEPHSTSLISEQARMKIRHAYVIDPSSHNTTPENQIWVNSVVRIIKQKQKPDAIGPWLNLHTLGI